MKYTAHTDILCIYIIYICILYVRILSDYDEPLTALQDPSIFCTACFLAFLMPVALQATLFYMLDRDGVATSACTRDCSVFYPVPVKGRFPFVAWGFSPTCIILTAIGPTFVVSMAFLLEVVGRVIRPSTVKTGVPNWQVSFLNLIGPWLQNREGVGANIFDVKIQCASGQASSGVESEWFSKLSPKLSQRGGTY